MFLARPEAAWRNAATRTALAYSYNSGNTAFMSRTAHFARTRITSMMVVHSNWYIDTNNNTNTWAELGTGSAATLKVGYEAPGGALSSFLYGGSASTTVASGADKVSDALAVDLQPGDKFYIRTSWVNSGGILNMPQKSDSGFGDRAEFSATDKTVSGTVSDSIPGYSQFPTAILANGKHRSAFLLGHSRTFGFNDTPDGVTGDIGTLSRALGPVVGYCNAGVPGDSIQRVAANPTMRVNLANNYYTDLYLDHAFNDQSGRTLAQIQADLLTVANMCPTLRKHLVTQLPYTSGAWTAVDGSDQTNLAGGRVTAINTWMMTKPSPYDFVHDCATVTSLVADNTKWKAPGYTDEGQHQLQLANLMIKAAGVVTI